MLYFITITVPIGLILYFMQIQMLSMEIGEDEMEFTTNITRGYIRYDFKDYKLVPFPE